MFIEYQETKYTVQPTETNTHERTLIYKRLHNRIHISNEISRLILA